jgi:hypothetical protein
MRLATTVLAASAAFVALASVASAAPVVAGGVYQEQITKNCANSGNCEIMFTAVPAAKTLIVTDVACVAVVTNTASLAATSLSGRKADNTMVQRTSYPEAKLTSSGNGAKRYQIQDTVRQVLLAGEKPRMFISMYSAPADFTSICTISGELK